jgi:DNA adenine methylase
MIAPFRYIGSKRLLAKIIVSQIPTHRLYAEPFFGSGQAFFRKPRSPIEVVNDRDAEVITFFRVCQNHHAELLRCLRFSVISRKHYADLLKTPPTSLTDILRACRFLYLQKIGYNGLVRQQNYTRQTKITPSFRPTDFPRLISAIHDRFDRVQIECLSYEEILHGFDAPDTFFYLDPPYFGTRSYRFNFEEQDYWALAEALQRLRGRFLLSLNDLPEIRKIFSSFHINKVFTRHISKSVARRRTAELFISNYEISVSR